MKQTRMHFLMTVLLVAIAFLMAGCNIQAATPNSDQVQRQQQEQISKQANATVGMPAITRFAEKRTLKSIIELRDQEVATITYTEDVNGGKHKLCDSVGFGISAATQYTNPQRPIGSDYADHPLSTIPQADPNGLFSPTSAEGTWVLCVNPETKKAVPLYVEPRIIVSPFPLK
jgi:hypothetical protein